MSSVRQHPIYFVPVFLFIFALAPATEGIIVFILSSDILSLYESPAEVYVLSTKFEQWTGIGEGRTDWESYVL